MSQYPARLTNESGVETFAGVVDFPDPASEPANLPGLRLVRRQFSWADLAARDPAAGVLVATVAADEQLIAAIVRLVSPFVGTDAALAACYVSTPGSHVSAGAGIYAANVGPIDSTTNALNGYLGAVYGAFALISDPTAAADVTAVVGEITLLILAG